MTMFVKTGKLSKNMENKELAKEEPISQEEKKGINNLLEQSEKMMAKKEAFVAKSALYNTKSQPYRKIMGWVKDKDGNDVWGVINPITKDESFNHSGKQSRSQRRGRELVIVNPETLETTHLRKNKQGKFIKR